MVFLAWFFLKKEKKKKRKRNNNNKKGCIPQDFGPSLYIDKLENDDKEYSKPEMMIAEFIFLWSNIFTGMDLGRDSLLNRWSGQLGSFCHPYCGVLSVS